MSGKLFETAFTAEDAEGRRADAENFNAIGRIIFGSAFRVHSALGPGLLESAYQAGLVHEFRKHDMDVEEQVKLSLRYDTLVLEVAYRIDMLVKKMILLEIKSVDTLLPIHTAQLLSYLRVGRYRLGYLINFNVPRLKQGIRRLANGI